MNGVGFNILASTTPQSGLYDKIASGEFPEKVDYAADLVGLHEVWGLLLIVVGFVYLLYGWKAFKVLVAVNAAALGALGGFMLGNLGDGRNLRVLGAMAGGVLLGVLVLPLMKGGVGLMGGLVGGVAGYGLWSYAANLAGHPALVEHAWAGALLGIVTLGLVGFMMYKLIVMVFTAFQGAMMVVSGFLSLLLKHYALGDRLQSPLIENVHLLPLLIGVPAVLGFFLQYIASDKKARKKKRAIASSGA